ncbi:MAG: hypothetical protein ISS14_05485, partial [Actinobacteria bacterium]|nr:hypothetical protein [Actinomycetota bacterium]
YLLIFVFSSSLSVPVNFIFASGISIDNKLLVAQESGETEIFDTGRLIPYYECPYDYTINVEDNFTRVEIQHYGEDGRMHKFGGWKAWLTVNESPIYEWESFTEGEGSEWYDYTDQTYYGDYPPNEYTDITDYIYPGENIITFYHYTEGAGSGIIVKVYYDSTGEEDTYQEEIPAEETTQDYTTDETSQQEDLSTLLEQEQDTSTQQETSTIIEEEDKNKLIFNFKKAFINPDNPNYVLGRGIPGLTEENLKAYQGTILYKRLLGPADYITAANSWEDIARLAVIESKVHYNYSQNLGYFKSLYNILSVFYRVQSFRESLRDIPKQFNTLKSVGSAKDLIKYKDTIIGLSSNLTGIYDTVIGIDREGAADLGFPELDSKVMFVIGAVTSGGWSVLGDISKELFVENAQFSINYEMEKATLNSSLAYHAQKAHELAVNEKISAEEINEFFFHVRRVVALKQLDTLLNIEDSVSLWQENRDLTTRALNFFKIINAEAALEADLQLYDEILSNYEEAENFLWSVMSDLGIQLQ